MIGLVYSECGGMMQILTFYIMVFR